MSARRPLELGVFFSERCLEHRVPPGFPERPERLRGIVDHLRRRGLAVAEAAPSAELREALLAVHQAEYVERFHRAVERGDGLLDSADNPLSPGTWTAAVAAVEATIEACDWVMAASERRAAFAAVRPPGHHAEHDLAMGFCYFNNAAIAAERLRRRHGAVRVAIFDFDVHHGNGTQHLFESRPDVLYLSIHQYPFYPGTGAAEEIGVGEGSGATVNVPLRGGADDEAYLYAIEETIVPAIDAFAPDALVLSAGFDAFAADPVGGMRVTTDGYRRIGAAIAGLADRWSRGRSLSVLEGGYNLQALPGLVEAYLKGLEEGAE